MGNVTEGRWSTGVPYLKLGDGPPLVMASGMTSQHVNPTGVWRRMSLSWAAPFAERFTVYLVNRRAGLAAGTTIADLAADYADAIEQDVGGPVLLHGTSTGGFVALQLAIDHPDLVRKLVVSAAACRLSPEAREAQADVVRLVDSGDGRRASARWWSETAGQSRLAFAAGGLGWLTGGKFASTERSDMVRTMAAEAAYDAEPELPKVQAPALVLGGTKDAFFSEDLFRRTAAGIPQGQAVILPGKGHIHVAGSKAPAGMALGFLVG